MPHFVIGKRFVIVCQKIEREKMREGYKRDGGREMREMEGGREGGREEYKREREGRK